MKKILSQYRNGNTDVILFDDGTKIRETQDNYFHTEFPESIDYKITNKCPYMCEFCHENSIPDGYDGDIMNQKFIETLHPGTELAIGGGAASFHPQLVPFLEKLKRLGIIPNMTVNQRELHSNKKLIENLLDKRLIYGLGVSFAEANDELFDFCKKYPNTVIHLIAGYHDIDVFKSLENHNLKILILGFKNIRRGSDYLSKNHVNTAFKFKALREYISTERNKFFTISFDNLALAQLEVETWISSVEFLRLYQGDDGTHTMYIDGVKEEFAVSSISRDRYKLRDDINSMFNVVKRKDECNL